MSKRSFQRKAGGGKSSSMNPKNMLSQMQAMQQQMVEAQEALANETVTVTAGGGAITIVITGHQRVQSMTIDPELLNPEDVDMLQDLLVAWELVGDSRRVAFETAAKRYLSFYLEHMRLEETVILPVAQKVLGPADWDALDAAFATNCDPLTGKYPRDPAYDRLFTKIVSQAPAPIGLGS